MLHAAATEQVLQGRYLCVMESAVKMRFRLSRICARALVLIFALLSSINVLADGWTPTDGGLVVNLHQDDQILISVWVDVNNNGTEEAGEEFFVENYTRYSGGYFNYANDTNAYYLKLIPQDARATKPSAMSIWTVDTALTRVDNGGVFSPKGRDYSLGGISYTIWNDKRTVKTASDRWRFYGDLESNKDNDRLCDVVFVIPTNRSTITSFDPERTLTTVRGRDDQDTKGRLNGRTGKGFLDMTYREVYWLEIPRFNGPAAYTNAALVTFNTTQAPIKWTAIGQNVAPGKAGYAYEDHTDRKPHHKTPRTIFRLYNLTNPFVTCPNSYFFAYNEQNTLSYRKTNNIPGTRSDSTDMKKVYTEDHLFPMKRVGETKYYQTEFMKVPVPDSSYFYVGWHDDYRNGSGGSPSEPLGSSTAKSQFTKIRTLPMKDLTGICAPAGACGRMVVDTTSSANNLDVKFDPAGYFLKISTGKNVRMRQVDANTWISEEMWTITSAWADYTVKTMLMTGLEFSESDPGVDIAGWSIAVAGTTIPVADHPELSVVDKSGYARITTNSTDANGHLEFVLADATQWIHYDNNGFWGVQLPDQYPLSGESTVTVMSPRIERDYTFTGWNTAPDGSGTPYAPDATFTFAGTGKVTLYAQGTFNGSYNVALSFINPTDNKRYFLMHPGTQAPRYARARHFEDWTNVWQGMANAENLDSRYISSFELRHPDNEVKAYQEEIPVADRHLLDGEFVLAPRRYTVKGGVDSLTFYEYFRPNKDEYLGLYYEPGLNTIVANKTWAGLFRSTSDTTSTGWPNYKVPYVRRTKLYSERYVEEDDPEEHPDSLTLKLRGNNNEGTYIQYKPATNQFDGVVSINDATEFQLSTIVVVDEHFVVLPDTSAIWRDTVVFGHIATPHPREHVQSGLIGKQLLACMIVDGDTVYFHPNEDKTLTDPDDLRRAPEYRLTQNFTFIPDSRVTGLEEDERPTMESGSGFSRTIVGGHENPINVSYEGNYIDIVDTLRISLTQGGVSKIKNYYGRWKDGSSGLRVKGATRYRDVIIRTKTYHYGAVRTHLVLTPEKEKYTFNPMATDSKQINFTLTKMTSRPLLDVEGNIISEEVYASEDITTSLTLGPSSCSFATDSFQIVDALSQHVTISPKANNKGGDNLDTLIISTTVKIDGVNYPVTARVPLIQTSLEGDELIWSVMSGTQRYYIMAGTGGLIFRKYKQSGSTLYKDASGTTVLEKGSANPANNDAKYITPWHFRYNPDNVTQLSLQTEYGVNRYLKMLGEEVGSLAGIDEVASSYVTYHYVNVYTNDNANEEEQVKLQYGADKWLKFSLLGGSGAHLELVADEAEASVFSWSYLKQEYNLLNNGAYPSRDMVSFGYNTNTSVEIQTRYKAYKEFSMLVGNEVVYLCRKDENDIADLIDGNQEWKTRYTITRIPDARDFDGDSDPVSGLSDNLNTSTLTTTISTADATTSPTNVKIGGKYVDIVDTLHVTISLRTDLEEVPEYKFKGDWSGFTSLNDAELKIPLVRTTYHVDAYDTLACLEANEEFNHTFPNTITDTVLYTFDLSTKRRTGNHVMDVNNTIITESSAAEIDVTSMMNLSDKQLADVQLMDEFGDVPSWCHIKTMGQHTITVGCTESGIRTPRSAYIYIAYIVTIGGKTRFINYRLTISQPSLFQYANNQHLVHSSGASGDPLDKVTGMQQVHENKRILYYYPDQDVELPVRESHFFGWWRWFREGGEGIGDTDIPEDVWRQKPLNTGVKNGNVNIKYDFPFRIIGDSVDDPERPGKKKLVTMGRYTVFHYKSGQYKDWRNNPPIKIAKVVPPVTEFGVADKPTVTYAVDISNYYDKLPFSLSDKNQVDTAYLDTMRAIPEPTLSIREVFELHPWTEMAERMDYYKSERTTNDAGEYPLAGERYMEDHVAMAPIKTQVLLSTEQRYNLKNLRTKGHSESLLGYYMRDDNWSKGGWNAEQKDSMIWCGGWDTDCQWYTYNPKTKKYKKIDNKITEGDDFLILTEKEKQNITTGHEFDTAYYCLRARSWASTFDGDVAESDSGAYMFNICRYMILFHDTITYGPILEKNGKAIITNDEIEQRYEVLERLNFDYNKPGTNDYTVYPHPLPWADVSYGYTYPETPDLPHNRPHDQSALPNFGEYGLVNRVGYTQYWYDMEQHGGAKNGYMIYCDGMSSSGQVAALSLTAQLCSGQKMFFSCYVGNPSNQTSSLQSKPNFIFEVQGSVDGSTWEDITSYMTGDIPISPKWYQIYFPIIFNEAKEYLHFRVRIYNMSSNWNGNDFTLDDMCVFATKPPLIAYQANTACKEKGAEEEPTHVLLRVDYQGITGEGYNDKSVYYTVKCVNKAGVTSFVDMRDGYLSREVHHDTICGKLYIPDKTYEPKNADSIFVNMNELLDTFDLSNGVFKEGYIYEILEGEPRPVKYVVHEAIMNPVDTFTVHMSAEYKELMSSLCGLTSYLKVSNQMVLELNGEEVADTEQDGLCANATYDLGLRVKGSLYLDNTAPISLNGTCVNDWLLYGDTVEASSEARYGYKYNDIVKVVKDILRCEPPGTTNSNQFAPNLAAVSHNEMLRIQEAQNVKINGTVSPEPGSTYDPYVILSHLVNNGFLKLYQSNLTTTVYYGSTVQYVIFPILGTGSKILEDYSMEVCPLPIFIKLQPNPESAKAPLIVGGLNRSASDMDQPVVVLASEMNSNHEVVLKLDSIMPNVGIRSVKLISTNDTNFNADIHSLEFVPNLSYPTEDYYIKGEYITLRSASTNNYYMRQGYTYTYGIEMQTILGKDTLDGGCPVGTVPFTLAVVPTYLRWDPQTETSAQWNNPDNWIGITDNNQPLHDQARFAPLSTSKVIIPATEGKPYPILADPSTPGFADSIMQAGFEYNVCEDIRFLAGAAIGQQQLLTYDNAVIDMRIPYRKWALRSAPVTGLLSGDLFIADADLDGRTLPWQVGEFDASGRNYKTGNTSFWLSLYSRTVNNIGNGDQVGDSTHVANADWSKVTNGMTLSLPPALGWAVYARTRSGKAADVRLPKNDDIYYYYYESGDKSLDRYEHNLKAERDKNAGGTAGKFAYNPAATSYTLTNEESSEWFIFGNPTMAFIDIWGFIHDNGLEPEFQYYDATGAMSTVNKASISGKDTINNPQCYLPPMHAMMVKAASKGTSKAVALNANRIVTSASQKVPIPASAPRRAASGIKKGFMTITAVNPKSSRYTSRLLLGQGYHNELISGEDALLTAVSIDNYNVNTTPAMPFNIYSVNNGYGLCIDLREEIETVPLSFYMSKMTEKNKYDSVSYLWFTGVNNIDGNLFLYDALTDTERPILDGICLEIETPANSHERRYYIRRVATPDPEQPENPITTGVNYHNYTPSYDEQATKIIYNGHVLILRNGHVYTMFGQKIR